MTRETILELARLLAAAKDDPGTRLVLAGLERAYPETAAELREVAADPAAVLGRLATRLAVDALKEAARDDRVLARGLGRLLGKGAPQRRRRDAK